METTNNMMRDLLLATASLINEVKSGFPVGCNGYNEKGGYYTAADISNVGTLMDNVRAHNGFISDGLMVKFREQKKSSKGDNYRGYKVMFELAGLYNGPVYVFTKSENEYKMYFDPEAWDIHKVEITYKPMEDTDGDEFKRTYSEPRIVDMNTGEWKPADRNCSVVNKVKFALSNKLRHYEAYIGDAKMFNEEEATEE